MDTARPGPQAALTALEPELLAFRRDLHAHPEISRRERRTSAVVADRLEAAGLRVHRLDGSGVIADLGPTAPIHRVALRADIDALPVVERTGLPWSSTVDGIAHACGHDVHTTVVLGAGLALSTQVAALEEAGLGVRLVFQPAEEVIPGGAHDIIEGGWFDDLDTVFALHCDPTLDVGQVGLLVGPVTSAADSVEVTLKGHGGHTSRPHLTQDLTYALAKVVTDVPGALARRIDPRAGAALVWGSVHAGGAPNVIPSTGTASGTLRMLDATIWRSVGPLVEELVEAVVSPYAVTAEVTYTPGVPPVVNSPGPVDTLRRAAESTGVVHTSTTQSLGVEDFAWYLTKVPGAMGRLGTRTPGGHTYDLHQGDLVVDEAAILTGARLLVAAVMGSRAAVMPPFPDVPTR